MNRPPRYPYPHKLPMRWSVETGKSGQKFIVAICKAGGKSTYCAQYIFPRLEFGAAMAWFLVEHMTMEALDFLGTGVVEPVGIFGGAK